MRALTMTAVAATAMIAGLAVAVAQMPEGPPEAQVDYRQSQMKIFGDSMKVIGGFVRDGQGTPADLLAPAAAMAGVAPHILELFPEGTAVGVGDANALPIIWANWAEFETKATTAQTAILAMNTAVGTGDADQIKAAVGPVGEACGGCHETFRQKTD